MGGRGGGCCGGRKEGGRGQRHGHLSVHTARASRGSHSPAPTHFKAGPAPGLVCVCNRNKTGHVT